MCVCVCVCCFQGTHPKNVAILKPLQRESPLYIQWVFYFTFIIIMPLAAVGQFCATASVVANKYICIDLIKKAARQGASVGGKTL